MTRNAFALRLLAGLGLLLPACSSVIAESASTGGLDELRISPTDTENWARLTLALPTGTCLPGNSCTRPLGVTPTLTLDGSAVALGVATRLKPGDHTFATNGATTKLTLTPGQNRTYVLPVARSRCSATPLPTVPVTDFGKAISLGNAVCPNVAVASSPSSNPIPNASLTTLDPYYSAGCGSALTKFGTSGVPCNLYSSYTVYGYRISNGTCVSVNPINAQTACDNSVAGNWAWLGAASSTSLQGSDQAFVPDTYSVTVATGGAGTTQQFILREGDLSDVNITLPVLGSVPSVFTTSVTFADPRELPNAGATTVITSSCGGDRPYTFASNAQGTVDLRAFADSACVYTLNAGGRSVTLNQSSPNALTLNRVDVDDVRVTREDGSTYTARGTYELYFGGSRVAGPYTTNTGIDALPGTYELVVNYTTADGAKTQRQTFTL